MCLYSNSKHRRVQHEMGFIHRQLLARTCSTPGCLTRAVPVCALTWERHGGAEQAAARSAESGQGSATRPQQNRCLGIAAGRNLILPRFLPQAKMRIENEEYLRQHPELQTYISVFMSRGAVLRHSVGPLEPTRERRSNFTRTQPCSQCLRSSRTTCCHSRANSSRTLKMKITSWNLLVSCSITNFFLSVLIDPLAQTGTVGFSA